MNFGIIYEYVDIRTNQSAYIGKSFSLYGFERALASAHRRHLLDLHPSPFDVVIRVDPKAFSLRIVDRISADRSASVQRCLKPMERDWIRLMNPRYNCVRFRSRWC